MVHRCAASHGLTIGSELSSGIRNVTISNVRIFNSGPPVRIKTNCGRGAYARDITYANITAWDTDYGVWVDQAYGGGPATCNKSGTTLFADITVRGLTVNNMSNDAFLVLGLAVPDDPSVVPIQHLVLQDVLLTNYAAVGSCVNANVSLKGVSP